MSITIDLTPDEFDRAMAALIIRRSTLESGLTCLAKYEGIRDGAIAKILGTREAHETAIAELDAVLIKFREAKDRNDNKAKWVAWAQEHAKNTRAGLPDTH